MILQSRCDAIHITRSLQEISSLAPSKRHTVIHLADLKEPLLDSLHAEGFKGFKTILSDLKMLLWTSQGRDTTTPSSNASVGLLRSLVQEMPHIWFRSIDFDAARAPNATHVAEDLVRLAILRQASHEKADILWPSDKEIYVTASGTKEVARIQAQKALNTSYNAAARKIKFDADPSSQHVQWEGDEMRVLLCHARPRDRLQLRIMYTSNTPVRFREEGLLYPCLGVYTSSDELYFALSPAILSVAHIDSRLLARFTGPRESAKQNLAAISMTLFLNALTLSFNLGKDDTIILHRPSSLQTEILRRLSDDIGARLVFVMDLDGIRDIHRTGSANRGGSSMLTQRQVKIAIDF